MNTEIITKKDLHDFFKKLFDMQIEDKYFYRGYSDIDQLNPSLVRNYDKLNIWDTSGETMGILKYEEILLLQYAKYSVQYLPHFHNSLDWVASAQHFGLPTRLIDWTKDPFVALFFSCFYNKTPKDGHYYLLVADKEKNMYYENIPDFTTDSSYPARTSNDFVNSYELFVNSIISIIGGTLTREYRDLDKKEFCKWYKSKLNEEYEKQEAKLFFCTISDSNPRIIAQRGLFQLPRRFENKDGNDCIADDIFNASEILFKIDYECRDEVIAQLEKVGINTPKLFPDLQNICEYIRLIDRFDM